MRYRCLDESKCAKSFQSIYGLKAHLLSCESAQKVLNENDLKRDYEYSIAYDQRNINGIKTNQYYPKFSSMDNDQRTIRFNFKDRFYDFDKQDRPINSRRILKPIESRLLNSDQVRKSLIQS